LKHIVYRKGLAIGIIILLSIVSFGASNVPGTDEVKEEEQVQELIRSQNAFLFQETEFPNEEYSQIQINDNTARVIAYTRDGSIKRLYGEAFSYGNSPEMSADNFLQDNAHLFGVDASDLEIQNLQPIMYIRDTGEYKFTGVNYIQYKEGIRVFRSRLILLVKNEENYPLMHASVDLRKLDGYKPGLKQDILNPEAGINNALIIKPSLDHFTQPELVIWTGLNDMTVEPILAYNFIGDNGYKNNDKFPEKYLFITDAETGNILYSENRIIFEDVTGNVQGKATQDKASDICEEELPENLMWARVNIGSTIAYADKNGNFTIPNEDSSPVTVESRLWGKWFRVFNQAGADTVLSKTVTPPGPANFTHNNLNNNEFLRAEINGYLQANIVRDFTLRYNPSYPGLNDTEFPVNVNINSYCNAYYDYESINFFRAGGGCPNTAFSTVIHHEYGHHLVEMAGSGQGQYGEGMSDTMGVLITKDPGLAYGFYGDCDVPLRYADNDLQYPCGGSIHHCGQLLSGCVWDTWKELNITDPTNCSDIISNIAINAILLHTGNMITPSITIDYLVLDDDNGNIYDGTPHYFEIAAGFGAHSMDAPPVALLGFEFPDGLPYLIRPSGGTTVRVNVNGVLGDPKPNTGVLHFNDNTGWIEIPMFEVESNVYDAVFPVGECQTQPSFYFSAETLEGETQVWPMDAPDEFFKTVFAYDITKILSDDFETDLGWTVENDEYLTGGAWERGIPVNGGRGDPPTDYDGSGQCYVTGNNGGESDVDDGITWLISPTINLEGYRSGIVEYALWYTNDYGGDPDNDIFKVFVSNDDGASWNLVERIGPETSSGWKEKSFLIGDYVTPTSQVKVRFEAADRFTDSVVEAGIDAFSVSIFDCTPPLLPDLECDGILRWENIPKNSTVTGEINIGNVGEEGSELNWKIVEELEWGTWTFTPSSGTKLEAENWVTVSVEVVAPDNPYKRYTGTIKVVNNEIPYNEYCEIEVYLRTPIEIMTHNSLLLWLFERFPNAFPILRQIFGL